MKVFYIVASNGDGSSRVEFYDSQECIDYLTDENTTHDMGAYLDGDGGSYGSFEVPEGTPIMGIEIHNLEWIKAQYQ